MSMNFSTAVFLINDDVRAIRVSYEKPDSSGKYPSSALRLMKTMHHDIRVGDYVVVPTSTRHNMTVVQVVETDVEPDLDGTATIEWVIGRVNTSDYAQLKALEQSAIDRIKSAEKRRKREELRKSLLADLNEADLKKLPLYQGTESESE